jgi:hypothetical protein
VQLSPRVAKVFERSFASILLPWRNCLEAAAQRSARFRSALRGLAGAPVRIKLRTPMLLRFRCNFVRLKDHLQLLNVSADLRVAWSKLPRASSTLAGAWRIERTTPRAAFRRVN